MRSNPDVVFEWLRSTQPYKKKTSNDFDRMDIEINLLERDDPIINLGLALYGTAPATGGYLFNKGDKTIKKAVLSGTSISSWENSWIKEKGISKALFQPYDESLTKPFLKNEWIHDSILTDLYERKEPYDKLMDDEWYHLISLTSTNKRLSTPYDDTWMDGWSEFKYECVFTTAWKLYETLPVNENTALTLSYFGRKLIPVTTPHKMDLMKVMARWNVNRNQNLIGSKNVVMIYLTL